MATTQHEHPFVRGRRTDVLLIPDLEAGKLLHEQLVCLARADCAGPVLGTRVPIVLTSRSDSVASRVASCAMAVPAAYGRPEARS